MKIAIVSYLNAKPFLYGLSHSSIKDKIDIILQNPAKCAESLLNNQVDLALVPIAAIPGLKTRFIVSDYCIGADNRVDSVMLFSQVPKEQISEIYLDYQSKTSVMLLHHLVRKYWKISVNWLDATAGYEEKIKNNTAGLIIGDRALLLAENYAYKYDLATAWYESTFFPFTFACWVATKRLPEDFLIQFNDALRFGVDNIDLVISDLKKDESVNKIDLEHYFKKSIKYEFDADKKIGVQLFLAFSGFGIMDLK